MATSFSPQPRHLVDHRLDVINGIFVLKIAKKT